MRGTEQQLQVTLLECLAWLTIWLVRGSNCDAVGAVTGPSQRMGGEGMLPGAAAAYSTGLRAELLPASGIQHDLLVRWRTSQRIKVNTGALYSMYVKRTIMAQEVSLIK